MICLHGGQCNFQGWEAKYLFKKVFLKNPGYIYTVFYSQIGGRGKGGTRNELFSMFVCGRECSGWTV